MPRFLGTEAFADPGCLYSRSMPASLRTVRHLLDSGTPRVLVSDLDGVLRVFDQGLWVELDAELGVDHGSSFRAMLGHPYLEEVTRGRGTHARWRELAVEHLVAAGAEPAGAGRAVDRWADTPATVDEGVLGLLDEVRAGGVPVFVFTNGTDRVPTELAQLGLDAVVGAHGEHLINSADLGHAKPDREAFERAHRRIEHQLSQERGGDVRADRGRGEPVHLRPGEVLFLDDSSRHVDGARAFGWQAVLHPSGAA